MAAKITPEDKDISMTTTENGALSWPTTMDAGVDLFFKTVRGVEESALRTLLAAAWAESPEVALRLIFQTRDCRGGKGEKLIFYQAMKWLHETSPVTAQKNLALVPFFGTWKDMLQLCVHVPELEQALLAIMAEQLKADKNLLETGQFSTEGVKGVSLCAKWAPTEKHVFDNKAQLAKKLAAAVCGSQKRALALYRKEYLVPLRAHLRVTEVFMCANDWGNIPYPSVPSRSMNRHKEAFAKHDEDRFEKYLMDAAMGKVKMQGKQMYPHELVRPNMRGNAKRDIVSECQWKVILDDLREKGSLEKSIALSDVSGSMSGTPMEVSIALGLLISELCTGPFRDMVITFESNPRFHEIKGEHFHERVSCLARAPWGGSTNFLAAMDLILDMAKKQNVPQSDMPDKLFVISDMQFDQADGAYRTNHQVATERFRAAGYEPPMIVYWNVRPNTVDFPAQSDTPGVALLAGYSPSLLKVVMDGCDLDATQETEVVQEDGSVIVVKEKKEINPADILKAAVSDERYNALRL